MLSLWPALSVLALVAARSRRALLLNLLFVIDLRRLRSSCPSTNPRRSRWCYRSPPFCWRGNGAPPSSGLSPDFGASPSRWSCRSISRPITPWLAHGAVAAEFRAGPHHFVAVTPPEHVRAALARHWRRLDAQPEPKRGQSHQPQGFIFPRTSGEHGHTHGFLKPGTSLELSAPSCWRWPARPSRCACSACPRISSPSPPRASRRFSGIAAFAWKHVAGRG